MSDILNQSSSLTKVAAECRNNPEIAAVVKKFIGNAGIGTVVRSVIEESGTEVYGEFRKGVAEAVFAYMSVCLVFVATEYVEQMRAKTKSCSCNGTHEKHCPLHEGQHPILHAEAIVNADDSSSVEDILDPSKAPIIMSGQVGEA